VIWWVIGGVLVGAILGVLGCAVWFVWYFKDIWPG
jgi:hypothetical protein